MGRYGRSGGGCGCLGYLLVGGALVLILNFGKIAEFYRNGGVQGYVEKRVTVCMNNPNCRNQLLQGLADAAEDFGNGVNPKVREFIEKSFIYEALQPLYELGGR